MKRTAMFVSKSGRNLKNLKILTAVIITGLLFVSCADALKLLQQSIQKPSAKVTQVKLTGISFTKADLMFDIAVSNPNSIGIHFTEFDYDLLLNKASFLKGQQKKDIQIEADGLAQVQLPLTLTYADIYKTFKTLKDADSIDYKINMNIGVNLPVIGSTRIPVSAGGSLPNIKLPSISLKSIKLKDLNLLNAKMELALEITNPNVMGLLMQKFNYNLEVNNAEWLSGENTEPLKIGKKGASIVKLPFKLNFLEVGSTVYSLLSGSNELSYRLKGTADLESDLKLLGGFALPFDHTGKFNLIK